MKKPWCAYTGDVACDCVEGHCEALKNRSLIDSVNTLIGYGLTIEEIAEEPLPAPPKDTEQ